MANSTGDNFREASGRATCYFDGVGTKRYHDGFPWDLNRRPDDGDQRTREGVRRDGPYSGRQSGVVQGSSASSRKGCGGDLSNTPGASSMTWRDKLMYFLGKRPDHTHPSLSANQDEELSLHQQILDVEGRHRDASQRVQSSALESVDRAYEAQNVTRDIRRKLERESSAVSTARAALTMLHRTD